MEKLHPYSHHFYKVQIIGWGTMALFNAIVQNVAGVNFRVALINAFGLFIGGVFFTSLMRFLFKKWNWQNWDYGKLVFISLGVILLFTSIWSLLILLFAYFTIDEFETSVIAFVAGVIPLVMIVLIWTLIYFSYQLLHRFHFNRIKRLQLEAEVQKAQLGTLKSQINPHFMFNTLNNIKALMLEDVGQARKMLTNFSELLGYSLRHVEKSEVLLEQELEILEKYFQLIKVQYEDKLQYKIQVDENLNEELVPPMILQLLVENAMKHGVALQKDGGIIGVFISKEKNTLEIQVKNTGSLQQKNNLEKTLGIGHKNIKERLSLIYGHDAHFVFEEEPPYVVAAVQIKK